MNKFYEFGKKLKEYRDRKGESITTVGKAIGIDRTHISKLENGHERPSKDVLHRLISHYSLSNLEATQLWNLADYSAGLVAFENKWKEVKKNMDTQVKNPNLAEIQVKIPENSLVLYTDTVFVTRTDYGIVFDFAQGVGPTNERRVVSRIGMSVQHAKDLVNVIQAKLNETPNQGHQKREKVN